MGVRRANTSTIRGYAVRFVQTQVISGGIISDFGGYRYHTFLNNAVFECIQTDITADCLAVGGGGAGGYDRAGGGGAGEVLQVMSVSFTNGSYPVAIGDGGIPNSITASTAGSGGPSSVHTVVANGGGGAGNWASNGASGASGGGAACNSLGFNFTGGTGTNGYAGGNSYSGDTIRVPGGGGGATGVGVGGNNRPDGGHGIAYNTWAQATGTGHLVSGSYYYGGGGGGGSAKIDRASSQIAGLGGNGGGGAGGSYTSGTRTGTNGVANTGGGGGGGGHDGTIGSGGYGGSGIVIIRYLI